MKAKLPFVALMTLAMTSASVFALDADSAASMTLAQSSGDAAASPAGDVSNKSITIGKGDTLWSLAARLRPGEDVAIQQMILALVDANPSVFPNGDFGRMRTGQRLVVPSREMIEKRSVAEAKRQYQALSQPSQTRSQSSQAPSQPPQKSDSLGSAAPEAGAETAVIDEETAANEEARAPTQSQAVEEGQGVSPNAGVARADELEVSENDEPQASENGKPQATEKGDFRVSPEAVSDLEANNDDIETPQLIDKRMATLALEKERQADQDELEVLRNRNQAMQGQIAQQQQELIELEEQLSVVNARAQQAEQKVQQVSTPGWQTWGWILNAVLLVLILGGLMLYKRRRSNGRRTRTKRRGETVASGDHRRDNEPVITPSPSSEFDSTKRDV